MQRLWLFALLAAVGCGSPTPPPPAVVTQGAPDDIEERVHNFCGGACHPYPPPDSFPRRHWRKEVERGFRFFEQSSKPLSPPPVEAVVKYYEDRSPAELAYPEIVPATKPLGVQFERIRHPAPPGPKVAISHINLVKLPAPGAAADREPPSVLACDMAGGRVMVLRPTDPEPAWKVIGKVPHPAHAEVLDLDKDGVLDVVVADLGSFPPTDRLCGSVVWLRGKPDGTFDSHTLLDKVGRVADVQAADFRGTGKLDLVVGVFGLTTTGEILFLENQTTDWAKPKFVPSQIDHRHGAIHMPVTDLNGDGKPDFVALIAQEHEQVVGFVNQGGGKFAKHTLFAAPHPGYGSSGIELVDMNGDGKLDILYTNGDILDEPYLFKAYHGVQWLENKGNMKYERHAVSPMYGVHNARAGKLCGTDRQDILAVSFLPAVHFPGREARKADAVVLFEQVAPGKFERHSLAGVDCDAVVCAVGDLYGTGRVDFVVGNFSSTTTDRPVTIWRNKGK